MVANAVVAIVQGRLRRPARPGRGARRGRGRLRRLDGRCWSPRSRPTGRSARHLRRRGVRRRRPPADRLLRPGPVVLRARPARRGADRVRPRGGARRGRLHRRPDPGHGPGHHVSPVARARRRDRRPASAAASRSPPSAAPSRRPTRTTARAARGRRCRGARSLPLAVVCLALGVLFGAAEVTTVAFADEQGHKALRRRAARPLGARQPPGRGRHGRDRLAARPGPPGPVGRRSAWPLAMSPLYFVDSLALMGGAAAGRRRRDRADDDRHPVADRAHRPGPRLTEGMAIMHTGSSPGSPPGAAAQRHRRRPLRRLRRLPRQPRRGRRRGRGRADRAAHGGSRRGRARRAARRGDDPVTTWQNWSGLETAAPTRVVEPGGRRRRRRRGRAPPGRPAPRSRWSAPATASPRSRARATRCSARRADRHRRGRPRGDDRHRPRRHRRSRTSTPRSSASGLSLHNMGDIAEQTLAGAISTGTHGTGGRGRVARRPGRRARAGDRHRRGAPGDRRREPRRPRDGPRRPRRARGAHHGHVPGRAALPARGARAADVVGRGAGDVRRDDGRRPTTSTCTGSRTPTGC